MNVPLPPGAIALDETRLRDFVDEKWQDEIVPALIHYIGIPAKSPAYDAHWEANGYLERALTDAADWILAQHIPGLTLEIVRLPDRTPIIFFDIPATKSNAEHTILLYGHLDKQPEFMGWRNDLGPWTPKHEGEKLYGRGGADDGYAVYAAVSAIGGLASQGVEYPRCTGIIETCEESGSYDLLPYVEALRSRLGDVGLVICLDSGCGNYDQMWLTTSLRGTASGVLEVQVLDEGVHSGDSSGVVPSSFRIMRHVLDRLEESRSGRILPQSFHCEIPQERLSQAEVTSKLLGDLVWQRFPWSCGQDGGLTLPTTKDPVEVLLNRTWRPTLSVTGASGLPGLADAGNVLRPRTAFKLSLRLPPLVDAAAAVTELKTILEANAPYNARVTFTPDRGMATGWNAPSTSAWLSQSLDAASTSFFGAPCGYMGQGGTIPLMGMLAEGFPKAQFVVCGVLGPNSNAHGPNEFLHVPYAKKLTSAVAKIIAQTP